jgi:hypothetical protein
MPTVASVTHPAGLTNGPQAGVPTAPVSVIGQVTKAVYAVSANAISTVDTADLLPLLLEGWQTTSVIGTLTHPAGLTGVGPQSGIGTAPASVIGAYTGKSYTVSANAISNVDSRDAIPLLEAGWR